MNRVLLSISLGVALFAAGGCKSKSDEKNAIRDGVVKHIAAMQGLNVNNMNITVTQTNIHGDTADASVEIRAKNGDASAPPMQLSYQMQKQGQEWVVIKGQPTGGMQHPSAGEAPPQVDLPPGHPSTNGTGQMPANHPDFNAILNTAQPQGQQAPAAQPPADAKQQQTEPKSSGSSSYKP
jgi:hypothetical protein